MFVKFRWNEVKCRTNPYSFLIVEVEQPFYVSWLGWNLFMKVYLEIHLC
jgi:hypothetical protein